MLKKQNLELQNLELQELIYEYQNQQFLVKLARDLIFAESISSKDLREDHQENSHRLLNMYLEKIEQLNEEFKSLTD